MLTVVDVDVATVPDGVPPDMLAVEVAIGASPTSPNEVPAPPPENTPIVKLCACVGSAEPVKVELDEDEAVCVWLTTTALALPPVSSAVSNKTLPESNPTGTRPAPKAVQVPNPNNVLGLVLLVALV